MRRRPDRIAIASVLAVVRASGQGKTAGKGHKGAMARAGHGGPGGGKPGFEGGQMKLTRRIPKRGFTNPFRVESQVVSLDDMAAMPEGTEVTREALAQGRPHQSPQGSG